MAGPGTPGESGGGASASGLALSLTRFLVVGGSMMFASVILFFVVLTGTLVLGQRGVEHEIPFTETLTPPSTAGWEARLDRFRYWVAITVVLILIAYGPFLVSYLPAASCRPASRSLEPAGLGAFPTRRVGRLPTDTRAVPRHGTGNSFRTTKWWHGVTGALRPGRLAVTRSPHPSAGGQAEE